MCLVNYKIVDSLFLLQTGPKDLSHDTQGVNYRALGDLFLLAEQRRDTFQYDVSVQMIEIYNEQVRDLLVTDGLNRRYPSHLKYYIFLLVHSLVRANLSYSISEFPIQTKFSFRSL